MSEQVSDPYARQQELISDPHIKQQVEAMYPTYVALTGVNAAASLDGLLYEVAVAIMALEMYPEIAQSGGAVVVQRGLHGYDLLLRGPRIITLHMTPYPKQFVPGKPAPLVYKEQP